MNTDIEAYKALFGADLTKLQDGVIEAIYAATRQELTRRRQQRKAVGKDEQAACSSAIKRFRGLSKPHHQFNHHWFKYLPDLLDQDWSRLFSGGDLERKYYVYLHCLNSGSALRFVHRGVQIKTDGTPFYVGKGTGNRAFDLKRNQGHGHTLRGLLKSGVQPSRIVCVVKDHLTEPEALELESKLIYFWGTKYESGRRGVLVNLDIPPRPEFD